MRFSIAILFTLMATTQVAVTAPLPRWDDKDHEAVYKAVNQACTVAGVIFRQNGQNIVGNALLGVAGASGSAAVAVTAAQGDYWSGKAQAAGKAVVDRANAVVNGVGAIGKCVGDACVAGYKAAGNGRNRPAASTSQARGTETRDEAAPLLIQLAEPEAEPKSDSLY